MKHVNVTRMRRYRHRTSSRTSTSGGYVVDPNAPWARCARVEPHDPHWTSIPGYMGGQCMGEGRAS